MRTRWGRAFIAFGTSFTLLSCSGSEGSVRERADGSDVLIADLSGQVSAGSEREVTAADALPYFEAYARQDPYGWKEMRDLASPGSPAHDYYVHQERTALADEQSGVTPTELSTRVEDGDIRVCFDQSCESVLRYSDFRMIGNLLSSFAVEGTPVSDNLAVFEGNDRAVDCWFISEADFCGSDKSAQIALRTMYQAGNGLLYVTFDLERGANATGILQWEGRPVDGQMLPTSFLDIDGDTFLARDTGLAIPSPGRTSINYLGFPLIPGDEAHLVINMLWNEQVIDFAFSILPLPPLGAAQTDLGPRSVNTPGTSASFFPTDVPRGECSVRSISNLANVSPVEPPQCLGPWAVTRIGTCIGYLACNSWEVFRWTEQGWQARGAISTICPNQGDLSGMPTSVSDSLLPNRQDCIGEIDFNPEQYLPHLEIGAQGELVKRVQQELIDLGLLLDGADGNFGRNTRNALLDFQHLLGLRPTGSVGSSESILLGISVPD
jgi:hypothetical protein